MKVVLIQGLLAPYRYPIFERLSKTQGWEFEVWLMGKRVKNRRWEEKAITSYKFKYSFLSGITLNFGIKDNYPFWINFGLYSRLKRSRPDVIIMMGWDSSTSFLAHFYSKLLGIKFVLYSDSTSRETSWRRFLTFPLVKLHVRSADALISGGTRSKIYLESLGGKPDNIYVSYNTVDVGKYQKLTSDFVKISQQTREKLGVGDKKVILYYGQLIERKGVDLLVLAYKKLKRKDRNIFLLLIGDGPFRENLETLISENNIEDVIILDNPGDEEICRYYAIATIFVLPSREDVWGLVVNEAMASGLPVIVSDIAGSSADLVNEGVNGYTFKSGDVVDLAKKINKIISGGELSKEMALNALSHISSYSPELTTRKFLEATESHFINKETKINFLYQSKKDFLSVIIPMHKNEKGLKETLKSLQTQIPVNSGFEVIVERDEKGEGSYKTRNKALSRSKGEFVAFIDAGTIADKEWLAKGVGSLRKHDYVGGPVEVKRWKDSKVSEALYLFEKNREFAVKDFFEDLHFFPATNLFVRRGVIEKIGGFDPRLVSSGDLEFGNRVHLFSNFYQYYDPGLKVYHQARNYSELVEKQKRLAEGFVDLGRFYSDRFPNLRFSLVKFTIKAILPPVWLFWKKSWTKLGFKEKLKVFYISYLLSFIQHCEAIRYGLLRGR